MPQRLLGLGEWQSVAVECEDGKIMLGQMRCLDDITYDRICATMGEAAFHAEIEEANLVSLVNWTMIPYMSDIWESLQKEVCAKFWGEKRWMFFDLADPEIICQKGLKGVARD